MQQRDANVPALPFPDNPDPNQCGIPTLWGGSAGWIDGTYAGQVVEPTVLLYDSHERIHVIGAVPSGTQVQVEMYLSGKPGARLLLRAREYARRPSARLGAGAIPEVG
jgi:hypothetical protein